MSHKLLTLNVRGLNSSRKRRQVFSLVAPSAFGHNFSPRNLLLNRNKKGGKLNWVGKLSLVTVQLTAEE